MIDYTEIFDAWLKSINPTKKQQELAQKRLDIGMGCEYRREVLKGVKWSAYCGDCGCPLSKKVFSDIFNACTKKKWENVDRGYLELKPNKEDKTLI
jgi:hypothetical protein